MSNTCSSGPGERAPDHQRPDHTTQGGGATVAPGGLHRPGNQRRLPVRHQRAPSEGRRNRRNLQRTLKDRTVLQVDQAEPEDQDLPGDFRQCGTDPGLDRSLRLFAPCLSQIQSKIRWFHAADTPGAPAQPVRQKEFDRAFQASTRATLCFSTDFNVEQSVRQQ